MSNTHKGKSMRLNHLIAVSVLTAFSAVAQAATEKPNILLIIADDMGLDASHCYSVGKNQAKMPNIEKMCETGMVFEKTYAAPVCTPTRSTIMSGMYGFKTGVGSAIARKGGNGLKGETVSLFDVLDKTDYAKAIIGKWHLASSPSDINHPAELGVDDYYGLISGGVPDYFKWSSVKNGVKSQESGYATTVFTDHAVDWIAKQQETPWFLWLAYNAPHTPFHVPPKSLTTSNLVDDAQQIRSNPLPYYNAALEALDTEIGRLLASMTPKIRDNTVVIFIGDNGTPGQVARSFYGNGRAKGSIFDGGTHIPMVVTGPGVTKGRSNTLVNTTDLHATIAGLAGVSVTSPDTHNLVPVFAGKPGERDFVYVEHFSENEGRRADVFGWAIRDDRYKLVVADGEAQMLFDLDNDSLEQTNLLVGDTSAEISAVIAKLTAAHVALKK